MKTKERSRSIWMMAALLFLGTTLHAFPGHDEGLSDTINFKAFYGKVVDSQTNRALPFATIEALGSNIATVTNIDGEFIIKIERNSEVSQLKISYIGFQNKILELEKFSDKRSYKVELDQSAIQLKQVTIRPKDAMELIDDVLANIRANYSEQPMMMRGFYRETIQRGRNYVSISEAIIDVYKGSYVNEYQVDQVKLFKGRKSADVERMDTVLFPVHLEFDLCTSIAEVPSVLFNSILGPVSSSFGNNAHTHGFPLYKESCCLILVLHIKLKLSFRNGEFVHLYI